MYLKLVFIIIVIIFINNKTMKIIGIDPSLTCTGYAVLDNNKLIDYGSIKTKPDQELRDRYKIIFKIIWDVVNEYKPDAMGIESQYLCGINSNSILKVVEVAGIIEGLFYTYCEISDKAKRIMLVSPSQAKSAVGVGKMKRKESKEAVKKMVSLMYKEVDKKGITQDVYDAISIAVFVNDSVKFRLV